MTNFVILRNYTPLKPCADMDKIIKIAIIEDIKEIALELKNHFNDSEYTSCTQVYHNAEEAIAFLPINPPDIVISDIGLPGVSGIQAIITLRELMPDTEFCMFTVFEDNDKIFQSLKAGAKGYILKNANPDKIIDSAKELYNGGSPMSPSIARKVIESFSIQQNEKAEAKATNLPLTEREYEILEELAQGLLYKEIATKLSITIGTVKQHIHKIYHKLQVNNRTEAINLFLKR
jgi:DNA-binding NarL/FixJ family response regulator